VAILGGSAGPLEPVSSSSHARGSSRFHLPPTAGSKRQGRVGLNEEIRAREKCAENVSRRGFEPVRMGRKFRSNEVNPVRGRYSVALCIIRPRQPGRGPRRYRPGAFVSAGSIPRPSSRSRRRASAWRARSTAPHCGISVDVTGPSMWSATGIAECTSVIQAGGCWRASAVATGGTVSSSSRSGGRSTLPTECLVVDRLRGQGRVLRFATGGRFYLAGRRRLNGSGPRRVAVDAQAGFTWRIATRRDS
jgi:hypothetical protein